MPRLTKRFVIACAEYSTGEYTHLAQAELGLASIERGASARCPITLRRCRHDRCGKTTRPNSGGRE
jgi:hypothetical protein